MGNAILTLHSAAATAQCLSHSSHLLAPLPLCRSHVPIILATKPNKHTHSTTTIPHHKNTIKTTEKSSILLHNLHDDYHHNYYNYHHHISLTPPTLSTNRSTMDQPLAVAFQNSSHTLIHPTTTTAQGMLTIAACNHHTSLITSQPKPPIQHYQPLDSIDDPVLHVMAPTVSELPALPPQPCNSCQPNPVSPLLVRWIHNTQPHSAPLIPLKPVCHLTNACGSNSDASLTT